MSNELKHADVIVHMAKHGFESVEGTSHSSNAYNACDKNFNPITRPDWSWRIKPTTITYTVTLEPPMRVMPKVGDKYFFISGCEICGDVWGGYSMDKSRFSKGNIWDTEAKAQAAFDALFSPLRAVK